MAIGEMMRSKDKLSRNMFILVLITKLGGIQIYNIVNVVLG